LDTLKFDFISELNMSIYSIEIDGVSHNNFYRPSNKLIIPLKKQLNKGQFATSRIVYGGHPASTSGAYRYFFSGIMQGDTAFWTMSEPYGAKYWWPCKMDLYDKADSLDITIIHPQHFHAAAPGLLVSRDSIGKNLVRTHWKHKYPVVNYLIAIAVAEYKVTSSTLNYRGKQLPMEDYLYK